MQGPYFCGERLSHRYQKSAYFDETSSGIELCLVLPMTPQNLTWAAETIDG